MLMMLVSCCHSAPLNVLTWVLPVESTRRLATFLRLESPVISLLQEWGRRRAGVEITQAGPAVVAGGYRVLLVTCVRRRCRCVTGGGGGGGVVVVYRPFFIVV